MLRPPDHGFAVHPDVVLERIEDSVIAVHLGTDRIVELNETAGRLLELIREGMTGAQAVDVLAAEYDAPREEIAGNVASTVAVLVAEQIVSPEAEGP